MHEFRYIRNELYCENLKVEDIARKFDTPLYIYSYKTILDHFLKLKKAFRSIAPLICFSVKSNSNLSIIRTLVRHGAGLDVVSGGELFLALKAGCPPRRIVYASVGKTAREIRKAIRLGILFLNVESLPELQNIDRIAKILNKRIRVAIRINPDVSPETHRFITTGKITNKFGVDFEVAYNILRHSHEFSNVDILGLHIHIGSQITESSPFIKAIARVTQFIERLRKEKIRLEYFNIGGGLGIVYDKETPQTAFDFASRVLPILKKTKLRIILEPGRFIVGNAGIFVVRVLYLKHAGRKKFVIVDGAMNDLIRPALYGAYHDILPLKRQWDSGSDNMTEARNRREAIRVARYDVVGPICESSDFFAKGRVLPMLKQGDYLAIMGAGAYGFSMSSNYNSRLRPAEVMIMKNRAFLIRKRETYRDLIRNELIVDYK